MESFEKVYGGLNEAQREAVDAIDGPLLVIAGPGTGKTQLLSARVANILSKTDVNPENILCLTFTEAGASAMRARLLKLVGPESARVNISTYHAFGSDIIYMYNNFAEKVARVMDAPIDTVRQHKILTGLRDALPAGDILRDAKISDLLETIREAKTARLSAGDLRRVAEVNLADAEVIAEAVAPVLAEIPRGARFDKALPYYARVREVLAGMVSREPIVGKVERIANAMLDGLNDAIVGEEAKEKPSTSALTKWRDAWFEKDARDRHVMKMRVANKKLLSLAGLLETYDKYLTDQGLFDFPDMIEEAVRFLREDDGFRYSVQERYQYVLLDEFQDTNDSQLELIRLVCDYEKPNVMAVGDDDQAIYAFQGARYSNLMDFQQFFGAEVKVLKVNYRSGQGVIDLYSRVADQIGERFSSKYGVEKRLVAAGKDGVQIERREFAATASEYSWVAGRIAELVEGGVRQEDIAVIAPKHQYLEALVPYLHEHEGLRLAYDKRENILESEEIGPLLTIARLVVNLAKVKPTAPDMLEVLSFPFWGVPAHEAVSVVAEMRERRVAALDVMRNSGNEKLVALAEFFAELSVKSLDTPLEVMVDYILGTGPDFEKDGVIVADGFRSPYLEYFAGRGEFAAVKFYESLMVLREHLRGYVRGEKLRLRDLVEFADDYAAAEQKLLNTSPYVESRDAVRLLTAHGSKGLEFENVFLITLDNFAWGVSKGNNNTLSLPKNLEFMRHTGATEDEKLRLLFVALSRAKNNLYLSSSRMDFAGKALPALAYLPAEMQEIIVDENEQPEVRSLVNGWSRQYDVTAPDMRILAERAVENYRLSATDLTTFVDVVYGGPEALYLRRVLRSPQAYSAAMSYGNFVHGVLDRVCREKISDEEALAAYRELALAADVEDEEREDLLERGEHDLAKYLRARGEFLRSAGHYSEVDFAREGLVVGGVPVTGKIDHIVVDEAEKTVEIVDFKTGKYHGEGWDSNESLWKYKRQLMFYKMLLGASLKYRGYEVRRAVIDFVSPDVDGEVRQRVLEFNDSDVREFERLCAVVYERVKALDFPDVTMYGKNLRGVKDFVAYLIT